MDGYWEWREGGGKLYKRYFHPQLRRLQGENDGKDGKKGGAIYKGEVKGHGFDGIGDGIDSDWQKITLVGDYRVEKQMRQSVSPCCWQEQQLPQMTWPLTFLRVPRYCVGRIFSMIL